MNFEKLKEAEAAFLMRYPGGFDHPDMVELGKKKHNVSRLVELAQEAFHEESFARPDVFIDNMVKIIGRSSMVSMFEKPKFRDFAKSLSADEKEQLIDAMQERLYGNERSGFESLLEFMATRKLAKWSLISICPFYFRPNQEVFVKPTTAKKAIRVLELEGLEYKPRPSWEFYARFRDLVGEMKTDVDASLSPNNAAFTGFLMMSL